MHRILSYAFQDFWRSVNHAITLFSALHIAALSLYVNVDVTRIVLGKKSVIEKSHRFRASFKKPRRQRPVPATLRPRSPAYTRHCVHLRLPVQQLRVNLLPFLRLRLPAGLPAHLAHPVLQRLNQAQCQVSRRPFRNLRRNLLAVNHLGKIRICLWLQVRSMTSLNALILLLSNFSAPSESSKDKMVNGM